MSGFSTFAALAGSSTGAAAAGAGGGTLDGAGSDVDDIPSGTVTDPFGTVETAALDRRDHRAVLLLHELLDRAVVAAGRHDLGVRRALGGQDLAAHVDERLDVRVPLALVFRLDVEDAVLVLDVGVESGDHGEGKL